MARPGKTLSWLPLLGLLLLGACFRLGFDPWATPDGGTDATSPDGKTDTASTDTASTDTAAVDGTADTLQIPDTGPLVPSSGTLGATHSYGGAFDEQGYDVAVDPAGNVIVVGTFQGSVTFDTITINGTATTDAFVAVFAPNGTVKWAQGIGGTAGEDRAQGVAVDASGNVYVCGLFKGTAEFGGQQRTSASSLPDLFLAAYDPGGTLRWVNAVGGNGWDFAYDVTVGAGGGLLLTGYYEGAVDFGKGALPAVGGREVFLAKYDTSGVLQWARGFSGSGPYDSGYGADTDAAGNIVLGGSYGGPIDLGSGPVGTSGSFVLKLTPDGKTVTWAKTYEKTGLWDVAVNRQSGRILVASRISSGADLGQGPLTPSGTNDALVVSLDAGGTLQWYKTFGGVMSDIGLGIAVDGAGNSYTIGLGGENIDFGLGLQNGNGGQDVFVVSHDPTGTPRWGKLFGGAPQDRGYGVAVAPGGAIYTTGRYAGTAKLDSWTSTSSGGDDIFLVQFK